MKKNKISVIIPVYHASNDLISCIQSVLQQGDCIEEILCVEDGYEETTDRIVSECMKLSPILRRFRLAHKGVSHARNIGIQNAKGTYLLFLDADDALLRGRLCSLYRKAEKMKADIVVFGGRTQDPFHTSEWIRKAFSPRNYKYDGDGTRLLFYERGVLPSVCNKLYKKELLKNIQFPEELSVAEDLVFLFRVFPNAHTVVFCSRRAYFYQQRQTSVIHQTDITDKIQQHQQAVELAKRCLKQYGKMEQFETEIKRWETEFLSYAPTEKKRNKTAAMKHYIKEYGSRSAIEYAIGKYLYKKESK